MEAVTDGRNMLQKKAENTFYYIAFVVIIKAMSINKHNGVMTQTNHSYCTANGITI